MEYKKPQATIIQGNVGIYPLTTADQVILADGTRLEKDGKINVDVANSADSAKLGGKAPEYYIQPRNLLDNSDFRNPVNQRGKTNYTGGGYTIDRWMMSDGSMTVNDGYITVITDVIQRLPKHKANTIHTLATKNSDGTVNLLSGTFESGVSNSFMGMGVGSVSSLPFIHLLGGDYLWAALYEGSYTADTLPPYVPKGYAAELAACLRYFERLGETYSSVLGNAVYAKSGAASIIISIHYFPKRIKHPTIVVSDTSQYRVLLKDATNCNTYSAYSLSAFGDIDAENSFGQIKVAMDGNITQDSWLILQRADSATAAYIDVSADL